MKDDKHAHLQVHAVDLFGPTLKFLTPLPEIGEGYALMKGTLGPGHVIPLHAHPDRETFYVIEGRLEAIKDGTWQHLRPGDVFDIPENIRHGFRSTSGATAIVVVVTTMRLARFMRRAGRPVSGVPLGVPSDAELIRFAEIAQEEKLWLGDLQENAAVGIAPMIADA